MMTKPDVYIADEMKQFEARFPHCDHTKYNNGEPSPHAGIIRYAEPEINRMFSAWLAAKQLRVDDDLRLHEDITKAIHYCDDQLADRFGGFIRSVLIRCKHTKAGQDDD